MDELKQSRISLVIHVVVALAAGWISVIVAAMGRSLFAIGLGLVILYATGFVAQKVTGQKGIKWWAANGIIVYLLFWFISWTLFFNIA